MTCADCSVHWAVCSGGAGVVNIFSSINIGFLFAVGPSWWSWDHHRTHVTQCHMTGHDTMSWHMTQYRHYEVSTQHNSFMILCFENFDLSSSASERLQNFKAVTIDITNRQPRHFIRVSILISAIICESNLITLVIESWKTIRMLVSKYILVKLANQMYCGRDHFFNTYHLH